jgi:hypothetical protein
MASLIPPPATLPVGIRAWCVPDGGGREGQSHNGSLRKSARRPQRFIVLNVVRAMSGSLSPPPRDGSALPGPDFLLGGAVIGDTSDWTVQREVVFYPDDLPESELAALRQYVEERTYRRGARPRREGDPEPDLIWRHEPRVTVELLPLSEFLKLFFYIGYKERALVIAFGLAQLLSALAADWHEIKKGRNAGAWRLTFWTYPDQLTGIRRPSAGWRSSIIVKRMNPDVTFIEFSSRRGDEEGKGSRYRGEFFDLSNPLHALTGRRWAFGEALSAFTGAALGPGVEYKAVDAEVIDWCRTRLRDTVLLTKTILTLFDRLHPVSRGAGGTLSETQLYTPGGLARAYAKAINLAPPAVPKERLGACAAASFAGWARTKIRGRVPDSSVDCRRQFQTVFLLQGLQGLLFAERLRFVDDTDAVRAFVERLSHDDCFDPEFHRHLNVICWIKPAGEMLIGRWGLSTNSKGTPEHFNLALAPRYSDEPVPLCLADVIIPKVLGGRAPEIIRAARILPEGRQRLRKSRILHKLFDPDRDQLFKALVEEGERLNQGIGKFSEIAANLRPELVRGVKAIGNIGCFGMLMETREAQRASLRRESVMLLSDDEPIHRPLLHPEEPGPFACPPLAALVTAGSRLQLALVHRLAADRGGMVAACDTDGAYIVSTPNGGPVPVETRGANFYEGGTAQPVHALSAAEVAEIADRFDPLNPFDRKLLPGSPLRLKGESNGLFLATKRYSRTGPDGNFVDYKESILGVLAPPSANWIEEAWRTLDEMWDGRKLTARPWFELPAVRVLSLSSPAYAREFKALAATRPLTEFLVAIAIGHHPNEPLPRRAIVIAPFEPDPDKRSDLHWRFAESGELVPFDCPGPDGTRWRLRTMREFLSAFMQHPIPDMLAPDGSRCGPYTRGVLQPRPCRDGERWLVLKEAAVYGDDPRHAFSVPETEAIRRQAAHHEDWESTIKPALAVVNAAAVAQQIGCTKRAVRAWLAGERQPENPLQVVCAIVAAARDAGLGVPTDEHLGPVEICAELPGRAALVQLLIAVVTSLLAASVGGVRALARAMGSSEKIDLEPTLRRWIALGAGELRPIADLNWTTRRLARFSRAELRKRHRRFIVEPGPVGDRQLIWVLLQLLHGVEAAQVPTPDEMLTILPALLGTVIFVAALPGSTLTTVAEAAASA